MNLRIGIGWVGLAMPLLFGCAKEEAQSPDATRAHGFAGKQPIASGPVGDASNLVIDGMPTPSTGGRGLGGLGGPVTFSGDNGTPIAKVRWDEADVTSHGRFEVKGVGTAEVEGVCSFADGDFECWDIAGKKLPELGKRIEAAVREQEVAMSSSIPTADIAIGSKNRLIVARITQNPSAVPEGIVLDFAGRYRQAFGVTNFGTAVNKDRTRYRLAVASESPGTKTTKAKFTFKDPIPGSARIDLKVGATTKLGGMTFKVAAITSGQENAPRGRGSWMVRIERSPAEHTVQIKCEAGIPSASVLALSNGMMERNDASVSCALLTDPAEMGSLTLTGVRLTTVDITGIPMDPKS